MHGITVRSSRPCAPRSGFDHRSSVLRSVRGARLQGCRTTRQGRLRAMPNPCAGLFRSVPALVEVGRGRAANRGRAYGTGRRLGPGWLPIAFRDKAGPADADPSDRS